MIQARSPGQSINVRSSNSAHLKYYSLLPSPTAPAGRTTSSDRRDGIVARVSQLRRRGSHVLLQVSRWLLYTHARRRPSFEDIPIVCRARLCDLPLTVVPNVSQQGTQSIFEHNCRSRQPDANDDAAPQVWKPHLSLPRSPAALLGAEWFPYASMYRPEMFCFVRSVRDVPVTLVDGNTGKVCWQLWTAVFGSRNTPSDQSIVQHH